LPRTALAVCALLGCLQSFCWRWIRKRARTLACWWQCSLARFASICNGSLTKSRLQAHTEAAPLLRTMAFSGLQSDLHLRTRCPQGCVASILQCVCMALTSNVVALAGLAVVSRSCKHCRGAAAWLTRRRSASGRATRCQQWPQAAGRPCCQQDARLKHARRRRGTAQRRHNRHDAVSPCGRGCW
jgi:hypothetical protein